MGQDRINTGLSANSPPSVWRLLKDLAPLLDKSRGEASPLKPECTDGVKNGWESDVDCGGPCSKCKPPAVTPR